MATSRRVLPILALVLVVTGACARPAFDGAAEGQKLLRRDAEWAELAAAGKDVDKIVSYWSDDAVVMQPGQPVYEGKTAIRAYVAETLKIPGFKIHWVSEKPVFSTDGTMAHMRASVDVTAPGPDGALVPMHLRGYTVWRREPDGEWRCTVDIANEPPPPAPAVH
jgi:ketosteroid isomerase-like protein